MQSAMATVLLSIRIPDTDLQRVEEYQDHLTKATGVEMTRTDAVLALLRAGLAAKLRSIKKR